MLFEIIDSLNGAIDLVCWAKRSWITKRRIDCTLFSLPHQNQIDFFQLNCLQFHFVVVLSKCFCLSCERLFVLFALPPSNDLNLNVNLHMCRFQFHHQQNLPIIFIATQIIFNEVRLIQIGSCSNVISLKEKTNTSWGVCVCVYFPLHNREKVLRLNNNLPKQMNEPAWNSFICAMTKRKLKITEFVVVEGTQNTKKRNNMIDLKQNILSGGCSNQFDKFWLCFLFHLLNKIDLLNFVLLIENDCGRQSFDWRFPKGFWTTATYVSPNHNFNSFYFRVLFIVLLL